MGPRGVVRNALLVVALGSVLALEVSAHAAPVPIAKGVVVGRHSTSVRCGETYCAQTRIFSAVKLVGRVGGVYLVGSATQMRYESFQHFCQFGPCPPTTPTLVTPFTISGTTAAGLSFTATCTSGSFTRALPETQAVFVPVGNASCDGGTSTSQGPFAFRFLLPVDFLTITMTDENPLDFGGVFVGILV